MNKLRASHILVKKLGLAEEILAKIRNGEDFSKLALAHSECPSRKRGGDLGFFTRGRMVKEFETSVANAKVGEIVGPVKTRFGYHIIKRTA